MMDEIDRMLHVLHALPPDEPPSGLSGRIRATVHRRHRRRQLVRRASSSLLAVGGLWLIAPGIVWLASGELFASGTHWLLAGMSYLNSESVEMIDRFWNGTYSRQNVIGSSLAFSIWLGALLLCVAIFLAMDPAVVLPPTSKAAGGRRTSEMSPSSVHT